MTMGVVICGICGGSSAPCCGCRDFTTGSLSNEIRMIDPELLARSQRRWLHEANGGGQTFSPRSFSLTKHDVAENLRKLREAGNGANPEDYA